MADPTSISLLDRLRHPGEQHAWERFVALYTPLLYYWAQRMGLRPQDAGDVVQEVFKTLVEKLQAFRYDAQRSFRGWLREVLRNKCIDRQRVNSIPLVDQGVSKVPDPAQPDDFIEQEYREYIVRRALQLMQKEFKPATWKACWAFVVEAKPAAVIARELGISEQAVFTAKWRVLRRLREEFQSVLE
jgi:RNA polymerase sigma-70 factor (ECF subfamily)